MCSLANAELKPTVALSRQLPVPGRRRSTACSTARTAAISSAWPCGCRSSTGPTVAARRGAASARVRQAEHGANAALDGARLELASASTELDAAREIVSTQQKAVELAREGLSIAEVSYENGVITATELNDARLSLLETEWELMQAKYSQIVAAARTRYAAGL